MLKSAIRRLFMQEDLNFLLTNRIPRQLATRLVGWLSRIEHPIVRGPSIAIWRMFADLDLEDAKKTRFDSLHDCFTRELKVGARPVDPCLQLLVSPCDAIIGAAGAINGTEAYQVKGSPYALDDLLLDPRLAETLRNGCFVTLRLTSGMYHRFHAPHDCVIDQVAYAHGDTWNVNPIALRRVEKLFCKNERTTLRMTLAGNGQPIVMVAVAAILVAGIRLHFLDLTLNARHRGASRFACDIPHEKGTEIGWFEHGSTILVFAPKGFSLCRNIREGLRIRMGEPLMRLP